MGSNHTTIYATGSATFKSNYIELYVAAGDSYINLIFDNVLTREYLSQFSFIGYEAETNNRNASSKMGLITGNQNGYSPYYAAHFNYLESSNFKSITYQNLKSILNYNTNTNFYFGMGTLSYNVGTATIRIYKIWLEK